VTTEIQPKDRARVGESQLRRAGLFVGGATIGAVATLAVSAILRSWPAESWTALAAWVTAAIAFVAGCVALIQLREARRLRLEQAQPYVAVFMESSGSVDERFIDLVIRNFRKTAALNVQVDIDPVPQRVGGGGIEDVWMPADVPVLVPGQEWRTLWDFAPRRVGAGVTARHSATVEFEDTQGRRYRFNYVLDWDASQKRMFVTTYGVHDAAKALREIDTKLGRWQESIHGGLAVTVRDGDSKDARLRTEFDAVTSEAASAREDASDLPDPR